MYPFQDDALAFLTLGAVLYLGGHCTPALLTRDEADPADGRRGSLSRTR